MRQPRCPLGRPVHARGSPGCPGSVGLCERSYVLGLPQWLAAANCFQLPSNKPAATIRQVDVLAATKTRVVEVTASATLSPFMQTATGSNRFLRGR